MQRRSPPLRTSAFSLVEITVALGIAAVGLVAMLGLLSATLMTNSNSDHDTMFASMTQRIVGDFRARPFRALWAEKPWDDNEVKNLKTDGAPKTTRYFFRQDGTLLVTVDGTPLDASTAAEQPDALYECTVTKAPDPETRTKPQPPLTTNRYNLLELTLVFSWPMSQDASQRPPSQRETIHASVARF